MRDIDWSDGLMNEGNDMYGREKILIEGAGASCMDGWREVDGLKWLGLREGWKEFWEGEDEWSEVLEAWWEQELGI